jgi:hypothetical protein
MMKIITEELRSKAFVAVVGLIDNEKMSKVESFIWSPARDVFIASSVNGTEEVGWTNGQESLNMCANKSFGWQLIDLFVTE